MAFATAEDLLRHFEGGGDLLDKETGHVYISDVSLDGEFFGIMVGDPVPKSERHNVFEAVRYAFDTYPAPGALGSPQRMMLMEAPGWWFGELAEEVIANPSRFAS